MDRRKGGRGLLLALAALIWGTAFVAQSVGMDYLGPCAFNGVRSIIGGLVLLPVIWLFSRRRVSGQSVVPKTDDSDSNVRESGFLAQNRDLLLGGACCGVLLAVASLLQQAGIQYTTAGKAGFLTSLYIVIVPVLGIFLGRRAGLRVWLAVVLALAGAWFLSAVGGPGGFYIEPGDLLVLCSAAFFSLHILVIDHFAPKVDGVKLSCTQFFVAGVLSLCLAAVLERGQFRWDGLLAAWGPLLYTGVLSSGAGYTLQILGQKDMNPAVASLILSLESVFAAVSGWLLLAQPLSGRELLGCGLVFAGVVLAQLSVGRKG